MSDTPFNPNAIPPLNYGGYDPITGETKESLDARRVDSKFSNRVHVVVSGGVARLSFGETVRPGETNWHTSVTMTAYDAIQFANLIFLQDEADRARYEQPAPTKPPPSGATSG